MCWSHFVEACSLLLKPIVTINDVNKGDETAILYGKSKCSPNIHLHFIFKRMYVRFTLALFV